MITKPEDAMPRHMIYSETIDASQVGGVVLRVSDGFTAVECAEIAKAYADCVAAEIMTQGSHGEAWRTKFKEWEGAQ